MAGFPFSLAGFRFFFPAARSKVPPLHRQLEIENRQFLMSATLQSLRIRHLALVDDLRWELPGGFVAVTGETGAGKSVILGALKLLLGERAEKTLVRTGADACTVEAAFVAADTAALDARLDALGLPPCEDGLLLLRRVFTLAGSNRQWVNGSPATLSALRRLGEGLVDLHGPHDHQSLLSPERQLDLLDAFARAAGARGEYETAWRQLGALRAETAELSSAEASLEREIELLRHQSEEIRAAEPKPGEDAELAARHTVAQNSRRLGELATGVAAGLNEADDAVLTRLGELGRLLRELARLDPAGGESFVQCHASLVADAEDLADSLARYAGKLEHDPEQLAALEERLGLLSTLKRKYGGSVESVLESAAQAEARLHRIEHRGAELERLQREIAAGEKEVLRLGRALSALRKKGAPALSQAVAGQLRELGFPKSEFDIRLVALETPGETGLEAVEFYFAPRSRGLEGVEFLFAPNPGEPPKPLRTIASSGEISRVMLAVKSALAEHDAVPLLVFDEIDANVGGEIASQVGAKMRRLAAGRQVLCITHLPQVAAQAGAQFVVTKAFRDDRTYSELSAVEGRAREREIARMLGGENETSLALAKAMLKEAPNSKPQASKPEEAGRRAKKATP